MEENLGGIRVVRAFAAQTHEMAKFDEASDAALELAHKRVDIRVVNTSAMNFSFFISMGLVLWFGGERVIAGRDERRHAGRVPHLHDHPADAGAPARPAGQFLRPRLDLRQPAVRLPRPRDRDQGRAGRQAARRSPKARCASTMSAFAYPSAPIRPVLRNVSALTARRGRDHRHRRQARQRQVDHRPPHPALLRCHRRHA